MPDLMSALRKFVDANEGFLPTELSQLQPFFKQPVAEVILEQYKLLQSEKYKEGWVVSDKGIIDEEFDIPWHVGPNGYGLVESKPATEVTAWMHELVPAIQAYSDENNQTIPTDISQLKPYVTTPTQQAALQKLTKLGVQLDGKTSESQK